jgi:hypothetical protein
MMIYMVRAARAKHPMPMGDVCITVCMVLFKAELNLVNPVPTRPFIAQGHGSYNVTKGLTGGPRVVESLYSS